MMIRVYVNDNEFSRKDIADNIQMYREFDSERRVHFFSALIDGATKKIKAVNLRCHKQHIEVEMFLDADLTREEAVRMGNLRQAIAHRLSCIKELPIKFNTQVISHEKSICNSNLGYVFLLKDDPNKMEYASNAYIMYQSDNNWWLNEYVNTKQPFFTNNDIDENIKKYTDFYLEFRAKIFRRLSYVISRKTRGVSFGYDGEFVQIEIFLGDRPTKEEVEKMEEMERDICCDFPSDKDYRIDFVVSVLNPEISIFDKNKNLGWIFVFRDELEKFGYIRNGNHIVPSGA